MARQPPLKIVLMRHGKPVIDRSPWMSAEAFGAWIARYNASGIDLESRPPAAAIEQAGQADIIVCSDLPRSWASAQALGVERADIVDFMFREMAMPHADWRWPRLPLSLWLLGFRVAWLLGYSHGGDPFKVERARAHRCAERLTALAAEHENVLFVGHGLLNRFIARSLARMGWTCRQRLSAAYGSFGVYRRDVADRMRPDGTRDSP